MRQSAPAGHKCAPKRFGFYRLCIEPNPLHAIPGHELVVIRCGPCGAIIDVRGVLPAPELVNNDNEDDCA